MDKKQILKAALLALAIGSAAASHPTVAMATGSDGGCDITSCYGSDCYEGTSDDQCCDQNDNCCSFPGGSFDSSSCDFGGGGGGGGGDGGGGGGGGSNPCPDPVYNKLNSSGRCCDSNGTCCAMVNGAIDANSCIFTSTVVTCADPKVVVDGKCKCPLGMEELSGGGCGFSATSCIPPKILFNDKCVCPPGQVDSTDGGCKCAPGKTLVSGDCVAECEVDAYQTCCPNPCRPCSNGTTPKCLTPAGTSGDPLNSSVLCTHCECAACPLPPDPPKSCPAPAN